MQVRNLYKISMILIFSSPKASGKGIADQDRNILSNQLLLLGFLRSAAKILTTGPIPSIISKSTTTKRVLEDDEEEEEDHVGGIGSTSQSTASRGRILVTLRNVPPYTLW